MRTTSGAGTPTSSKQKEHAYYKANNELVKACALNRWREILIAHGIPEHHLSGKHSSCPIHGGKDGFRFNDEGKGAWVCATCTDGKFEDGFNLIARYCHNGNNKEAFRKVAKYLKLSNNSPLKQNKVVQPHTFDQEHHTGQMQQSHGDQKLLARKSTSMHAGNILSQCSLGIHPYLQDKGIEHQVFINTNIYEMAYEKQNASGRTELKKQTIPRGALVIPINSLYDDNIIGVQFINTNGKKTYIAGTPINEGIHVIAGNENLPYIGICEGYATSLSVFIATGATTVVVFDKNGIKSKAESIKASYPGKQLIFFGDNDESHKGQEAALWASRKTNGLAVIPPHVGDWNDYHQKHGIEATKAEIEKQQKEQKGIRGLKVIREGNIVNFTKKHQKITEDDNLVPFELFPLVTEKGGILNHPENIKCLLIHYKIDVRFNLVSKKIEINIPEEKYSKTNESECQLTEIAALCVKNRVPKSDLSTWLLLEADKNRYSPAVEWIKSKPWDGVSRIDDFINTVEADNQALAKKLIYRWMLGAVAAAFSENGVSLPGVLVFQGKQGIGKTQWFKALVPQVHHSLIAEGQTLDPRNKDSVIGCTSHWLVELGELDGTFNKSDMAALKAFLTRNIDYYRAPYARAETSASRNTAFFGSVNNTQYLMDETGNRRWWSISVKSINWKHDINMQQVFAEFKHLLDQGASYYLTEEEYRLLNEENQLFEAIDPMEEKIINRYHWGEQGRQWRTACEVLEETGFDVSKNDRRKLGKECGAILTKLTGNKAKRMNGKSYFNLPRQKIRKNFQSNDNEF